MKKLICSLLVFAGLGMCACNSKDVETNKDEVFNSAFFSEDSLVKMAEKKGYIEFDEFSKEVGKELTKGIIIENPVLRLVLGTCPTLATTTSAP